MCSKAGTKKQLLSVLPGLIMNNFISTFQRLCRPQDVVAGMRIYWWCWHLWSMTYDSSTLTALAPMSTGWDFGVITRSGQCLYLVHSLILYIVYGRWRWERGVSLVTYCCEREWRRGVGRSQKEYLKILRKTGHSKRMGPDGKYPWMLNWYHFEAALDCLWMIITIGRGSWGLAQNWDEWLIYQRVPRSLQDGFGMQGQVVKR